MLFMQDNEKILLVVHKHWFTLARIGIIFFILLLIPPAVLTVLPYAAQTLDPAIVEPLTDLALSVYILVLLVFLFLFWMQYYLNMWIVTTRRIIDVQQKGLFSREIAEIPLSHVQDVTIDVSGIFQTFLKFGTIRVQTAGEREFAMTEVPDLYAIKNVIVKYSSLSEGIPSSAPPSRQELPEPPRQNQENF